MTFTIVDWNVNGFALKGQVDLLDRLDWDVALLQEVTRDTWPSFRELGTAGGVAFDHHPPLVGDGPRYASAVIVRDDASLHEFGVVPDVPSPERAAIASVDLGGRHASVCSWAPPGVSSGKAGKGRQVVRFAAWLQARPGPVVVGSIGTRRSGSGSTCRTTSGGTTPSPRCTGRTAPTTSETPSANESMGIPN